MLLLIIINMMAIVVVTIVANTHFYSYNVLDIFLQGLHLVILTTTITMQNKYHHLHLIVKI